MATLEIENAWAAVEATVRGYLHRRLRGDESVIDDLAQEVFLRMRTHVADLRSIDRLGPWVLRITRNALIDHLRRSQRSVSLTSEVACPHVDEPFDAAGLAAFACDQVEALAAHESAAVRLVDLQGIPPTQAASQLGIGLPALKARLRRGRQRVREAIDRCCAVLVDTGGRPTDCEPRTPAAPCASCT